MTNEEFKKAAKEMLCDNIIPYWKGLRDEEYGGFYGYMDYDLNLDKKAMKGCILNSRICWFFSRAYKVLGDPALLDEAKAAFEFMRDHCFDKENGGIYWSVTYDGKPDDTTKHTYNQAFSIYALSEYYEVSDDPEALLLAYNQYYLIETKMKDEVGYLESLDREFNPVPNDKLSENGVMADRTMNTMLHVLEAYSNLYRVSGDDEVKESLKAIVNQWYEKVWNPAKKRQEVFFDNNWKSLIDLYSCGHDIETSWLMDEALALLNDPAATAKVAPATDAMADNILKNAFDGHSLPMEIENGVVNEQRIWWAEAECVVGFLNAASKHPERKDFREAAEAQWDFIEKYVVDHRPGGEWLRDVNKDGSPMVGHPVLEQWKCPYHNGRLCFEIMSRL